MIGRHEMKSAWIVLFSIVCLINTVRPNTNFSTNDSVTAIRLKGSIDLDGLLLENVWQNGHGVSRFTQRNPNEGEPATCKTVVHVAYDDEALYIGAKMYDSAPDSIIARLGRKDAHLSSDAFYVFIDPYNDNRSGYYFALNAAGTFYDGVMMNDEWNDNSWDGIWEGKVNIDKSGWTAEMRIPYSQLRFQKKEKYTWGINFNRDIARYHEEDYLVFTPKNGSGFVSRFPDLVGLENISPSGTIEILPYVRTKAEYLTTTPGDPFNDGSRYLTTYGGDFKWRVSSNLTLDATINSDFGQVEVDPAVVNLGDVETYFNEKRPFFIEGASIFRFGYGGSRSNWSFNWGNPNFFYSRRIGRSPQGSLPDYDYVDMPEGVHMLGAAKVTGKIGENWNVGTIQAITNREYAALQHNSDRYTSEVEPLTYYGVFRTQKEVDQGRQGIGFISTITNRFFKDNRLRDDINSDAYSFGLDGWTFLDNDKEWVITAWGGMSHVRGNKTRMISLQRSSRHYLQRPDASHVRVDSTTTSMTGYSGRLMINKQKGNFLFNSAIGFIDPKFEVNDLGFMWRGDVINAHIGSGYKWTEPSSFYRFMSINTAVFGSSDFDQNIIWSGYWMRHYIEFLNFYSLNWNFAYNPQTISNRMTRGGPLTIIPPGWQVDARANSDSRKHLVFGIGTSGYTRSSRNWNRSIYASVEWRPSDNISLSFSPQFSVNQEYAQWVTSADDPEATETYGQRYIFAEMDQKEFSASIHLNWTFTPKLSFQCFMQPLLSSGDYYNYKYLAKAKSYNFVTYGRGSSQIRRDGGYYYLDTDGEGSAESIVIENPDFNIKSMRINAVLRWEYLPGSLIYLVWTQNRFNNRNNGFFHLNNSIDQMFSLDADNIFMVKLSYWLGI